ncbi:MAG: DegV family protein [Anaerolineae bacterium]
MIRIVTDSTCDMPAGWAEQYGITIIPVNIQFGLESFQEGVSISAAEFYRRISQSNSLPTTSQPAVGEIMRVYEGLRQAGHQVLSLHLTGKLSGTWQAATLAARQLADPDNICVMDSATGSVGLGLMAREAALLAAQQLPLADIARRLEQRRSQISVLLMLHDLRFARMSGRVGRVKELLTSLLQVKPIIGVEQGDLRLVERVRGQKRGFERMVARAAETLGNRPVHVAVAHAQSPDKAAHLLELARGRLNCADTFVTGLALSIAVHFGPGTVGFVAYPAD